VLSSSVFRLLPSTRHIQIKNNRLVARRSMVAEYARKGWSDLLAASKASDLPGKNARHLSNSAQQKIWLVEDNRPRPGSTLGKEIAMPELHLPASIPSKILLPIDFSPSSQAALEIAADLAAHFHASLYLVNVIPMFPTTTLPDLIPETEFIEERTSFAERHLAKCIAALTARGVKATSSVEVGNDIVGNLMEVVDREHIDMVVISTHGISGWHPLIFGSIAEKVVKLVQCPLLLLRSAKSEEGVKTGTARASEWW
jgi:nucleotide-binding universal stress UspA family protein